MTAPLKKIKTQWILLRGLAREAGHWGAFPQELQSSVPGSRVDCLDLPGAGRYSEMKCPISISAMTEFVREKFLELRRRQQEEGFEPAKDVHLVAVSLGGMVAAEWLHRWPDDFKSCVLINTSFKGYSPTYKRLLPASLLHIANIARSRDWLNRERHVLKMVSNRTDLHEKTAREWARLAYARPITAENFARQLFAASQFSPKLKTPPCPVLILNSVNDRMVDPSCSELIARKWNAELRRHPTAGHDLPHDDSTWTVTQIHEFWAETMGVDIEKSS